MQPKFKAIWPLDLSKCTQPPGFNFLPDDWAANIETEILKRVNASEVQTCENGQVCMLLKDKTFDVIAEFHGNQKATCVIDHPIMQLASQIGDMTL